MNRERYTPDLITALGPDEVFVFGSNALGHHGGGAALQAFERFGAEWGMGEGPSGRTYAIPTLDAAHHRVTEEQLAESLGRFIAYVRQHPRNTFYLTLIGCGIAGWEPATVRRLLWQSIGDESQLPDNLILPRAFSRQEGDRE